MQYLHQTGSAGKPAARRQQANGSLTSVRSGSLAGRQLHARPRAQGVRGQPGAEGHRGPPAAPPRAVRATRQRRRLPSRRRAHPAASGPSRKCLPFPDLEVYPILKRFAIRDEPLAHRVLKPRPCCPLDVPLRAWEGFSPPLSLPRRTTLSELLKPFESGGVTRRIFLRPRSGGLGLPHVRALNLYSSAVLRTHLVS